MDTVCLLGVNVSRVNLTSAIEQICRWVREGARTFVCVAPVATLVDARRDAHYRQTINQAGMVTPDGMPVVWLARMNGCAEVQRTYGPDLMKALCQKPGLRHFFLGGTPESLKALEQSLKKKVNGINIVGMVSTPFRPQAQMEEKAVIDVINQAKPDILWVGLGSPKQDFWMALHRPVLNVPVMVGVGAAFDFLAGIKPQAPRFMQNTGFEWLFRLCCEPQRLWKRYLVGNCLFLFYLIKDSFKRPSIA